MTSRRDFLNLAMKGSALTATAALMPEGASAARDASKDGTIDGAQSANSSSQGHYRPPFKFGIGGVPLGMNSL
jgi:D-threo-aldose 1-dehydrogenase